MWFYLGILTAFISLIYHLRQKFKIRSFLQKRNNDLRKITRKDGEYHLHFIPKSDKKPAYGFLQIACNTNLQFLARHETGNDKLAKAIGLSYEQQTKHKEFDYQFYLASVTQEDAETLGENQEVIELMSMLLSDLSSQEQRHKKYYKQNELNCDGKSLYLKIAFKNEMGNERSEQVIARLKLLKKLAELLKTHPADSQHFWKVPARKSTAIILAISTTLATIGAFEVLSLFSLKGNKLFEPLSIVPATLIFSLIGLICLIFATLVFVKKSARKHLILIEVCLFGFFGLIFTSYGFIYDINLDFDKSTPKLVSYQVIEKYTERHRSRRRGTYYTYHIILNNPSPPVKTSVKIDSSFYSQLSQNDYVTISIKKGFFNIPWQEYMTKCEACKTDF